MIGTLRALLTNTQAGGIRQGGSSLTQQLVKNILVESSRTDAERDRARAPSMARKISELRLALALEKKYRKDEILEKYLNIAYFGAGAHGIEAAARRFFSTTAAGFTLTQAATLAGAVRTPYSTDPSLGDAHRAKLKTRRDLVLDRMAGLSLITQEQAARAKRSRPLHQAPPRARRLRAERASVLLPVRAPRADDEPGVRRHAGDPAGAAGQRRAGDQDQPGPGGAEGGGAGDPAAGGADGHRGGRRGHGGAGHGRIRAMAASKGFGRNPGDSKNGPRTTFNLAADVRHGGGQGLQAGSTFKVFTLATALKQGWKFGDGFDTPGALVPGDGYRDCKGRPVNAPGTTIHNASGEGEGGPHSIETGTWKSVNIFYMMLERKVGLCNVVKTARALGISAGRRHTAARGAHVHAGRERDGPADGGGVLRDVRGPGQILPAARDPGDRRQGRPAYPRVTGLPPGDRAGGGRRGQPRAGGRLRQGDDAGAGDRPAGGGQDRHQQRLHLGLVRRLHPEPGGGGQRRRHPRLLQASADGGADRRRVLRLRAGGLAAGADLGGLDERRAARHRGEGFPRTGHVPLRRRAHAGAERGRGTRGARGAGRSPRGTPGALQAARRAVRVAAGAAGPGRGQARARREHPDAGQSRGAPPRRARPDHPRASRDHPRVRRQRPHIRHQHPRPRREHRPDRVRRDRHHR